MTLREDIAKELYKRNPQFKQTPGRPHPPYSWEELGTKELYRIQADAILALIHPKFDEIKRLANIRMPRTDYLKDNTYYAGVIKEIYELVDRQDEILGSIITLCNLDEPEHKITLECGFCYRSKTIFSNEPIKLDDVKNFAEKNDFLFENQGGLRFVIACVGCKPKGLFYKKCNLLCFGSIEQAGEHHD